MKKANLEIRMLQVIKTNPVRHTIGKYRNAIHRLIGKGLVRRAGGVWRPTIKAYLA